MRLKVALLVLFGFPAVVAGQSVAGGAFPPLPPIGLPLPAIGLPPAIDARPPVRGGHPSQRIEPTVVYLVPGYYGWGYPHSFYGWGSQHSFYGWGYPHRAHTFAPTAASRKTSSSHQKQKPVTGSLRLDVEPRSVLQVYVDGYYVGTPDDLNGELELEAGPHKIEIRAPGYETLSFDVNIVANRSITYRGVLRPVEAGLKPGTTAVTPQADPVQTFYLIPGCYVGNVPPKDAGLPATCDQSRVVTFGK